MESDRFLDPGVDPGTIRGYGDYQAVWKRLSKASVQMVEKNEQCLHNLGDRFVYTDHYDKPAGIRPALHHVLQLYLWRVSVGFPSRGDDAALYRVHCPDKRGTVWELRRTVSGEEGEHENHEQRDHPLR